MDQDRFDGLTRSLGAAASRRSLGCTLVGGGLGALFGSALGALNVDAKKKRHKKRKKRKSPPTVPASPPPAPTCVETCPSPCGFCFIRPAAPPMCGNGHVTFCTEPCTSDNDCTAARPFCVSQVVNRATEAVTNVCPTPGGFCSKLDACT